MKHKISAFFFFEWCRKTLQENWIKKTWKCQNVINQLVNKFFFSQRKGQITSLKVCFFFCCSYKVLLWQLLSWDTSIFWQATQIMMWLVSWSCKLTNLWSCVLFSFSLPVHQLFRSPKKGTPDPVRVIKSLAFGSWFTSFFVFSQHPKWVITPVNP